jgi:hypothetical protein
MGMADYVQARWSFSCSLDSNGYVPFAVGAGEIFETSDEVVRRFPKNFQELVIRDSASVRRPLPRHPGAVETASAAPGEMRAVAHPPPERARKSRASSTATATSDGPSEV